MPTSTRLPLPLGGRSTPVARQHLLEASTSPCPYKPLYAPDIYYFSFSFFPHVVISTRVCPYSEHQAGLARNKRNGFNSNYPTNLIGGFLPLAHKRKRRQYGQERCCNIGLSVCISICDSCPFMYVNPIQISDCNSFNLCVGEC